MCGGDFLGSSRASRRQLTWWKKCCLASTAWSCALYNEQADQKQLGEATLVLHPHAGKCLSSYNVAYRMKLQLSQSHIWCADCCGGTWATVALAVPFRAALCLWGTDGERNRLGNICRPTKASVVQPGPSSALRTRGLMLFDYPVISPCVPCGHPFLRRVDMDGWCYTSVNCTQLWSFLRLLPL